MATAIIYDGAAQVFLAGGATNLSEIGYTKNGVTISQDNYYNPVPCDLFGGQPGPEIDNQALGITANIRLDLTKFDWAVVELIQKLTNDGTLGSFLLASEGQLMVQEGKAWRVLIKTPVRPYNFPICIVTAFEQNKAVLYKNPFITFKAMRDPSTGLLWNTTTT